MGKLNARFISVTISKSELLHYTDGNNAGLYLQSTIAFSDQLIENIRAQNNVNGRFFHYNKDEKKCQCTVFHNNTSQNNHPVFNDKDFFLFFAKNMDFLSAQYKWREIYSDGHENTKTIFEKVKKFTIDTFRVVDGFKCIIKIPDKLAPLT
ncbi:hypothetical protein SCA31_13860 [Chryseobacterium sp. SIMBA_028]